MPQPLGLLERNRERLERALHDALPADSAPVAAAARYVMGWEDEYGAAASAGGKRLRPLLTLAVAELCGSTAEVALPGAVAIELIHNFSLVHDEIQDRDAVRHGRPTLWARFGAAQAINAGDLLFARAYAALAPLPAQASGPCMALLSDATERMIRGQWLDLQFEARTEVAPTEYLDMVAGKTGALIGAAAAIGAAIAGLPEHTVGQFERWGVAAGLAFQAQDDYLGLFGDRSTTGKSTTNDLRRKKKTLPVLLGLADERCAGTLRTFLAGRGDPALIPGIVEAMAAAGIADANLAAAHDFRAESERLLNGIELDEDARMALLDVGRLLVDRDR